MLLRRLTNIHLRAGWLVEVEMSNPEELESLLNEDAYQAFINEGEE